MSIEFALTFSIINSVERQKNLNQMLQGLSSLKAILVEAEASLVKMDEEINKLKESHVNSDEHDTLTHLISARSMREATVKEFRAKCLEIESKFKETIEKNNKIKLSKRKKLRDMKK